MTKDERQAIICDKFIKTGGCGTFEGTTAFGKTKVAIMLAKFTRRTVATRSILVIVPRENLKDQWEAVLAKSGLDKDSQVVIINTAIKNRYKCHFLILDEIHRYGAETFFQLFDQIEYKHILGLTATMKRSDKRHKLLQEKCPVFDRVTLEEARRNGWVSDYLEINLGLNLSPQEQVAYDEMESKYNKCMDLFQWDFGLMAKCCKTNKPQAYKDAAGNIFWEDPPAVQYARKNGWKGFSADIAQGRLMSKLSRKVIWGSDFTHPFFPDNVNIIAINGVRLSQKIKAFINNHTSKISAALSIIEKFPAKTITFAESTAIADELTKRLNAIHPFPLAKSYHSAVPAIIVSGKKLSKKATREYILESFRLNDIVFLNTARAVDEGADFPDVQQGITTSRTSSPTQQTQRRGRIIRVFEDKFAFMWNIYLKKTKESAWLQRAQNYSDDVLWVDSLEEVEKFLSDTDERETDS